MAFVNTSEDHHLKDLVGQLLAMHGFQRPSTLALLQSGTSSKFTIMQ